MTRVSKVYFCKSYLNFIHLNFKNGCNFFIDISIIKVDKHNKMIEKHNFKNNFIAESLRLIDSWREISSFTIPVSKDFKTHLRICESFVLRNSFVS